jgi:hypothetical protein
MQKSTFKTCLKPALAHMLPNGSRVESHTTVGPPGGRKTCTLPIHYRRPPQPPQPPPPHPLQPPPPQPPPQPPP